MKKIKLPNGEEAIVDDQDYEWAKNYEWHFHVGKVCRYVYQDGQTKRIWLHQEVAYRNRVCKRGCGRISNKRTCPYCGRKTISGSRVLKLYDDC
jgi:hypothetical protein